MGRYLGSHKRGADARFACALASKRVRTLHAQGLSLSAAHPNEIVIGLCVANDGAAGIWTPSALASAELAVAELNQADGIAGRKCRLLHINANVESVAFEEQLLHAIEHHGMEALVGMHTSDVRERIVQAVGGMLPYVYTPLYEGGEQTPGVFTLGETPAQQLFPAIDWLSRNEDIKRWLLVGNDYIWPKVSHRLAQTYVQQCGGQVLDSIYLPFGTNDFSAVLDRMQSLNVDAVLMSLVGQDAVVFNRQFGHAGLSQRAVRLSCAIEENVLLGIGADKTEGLYVASSYFSNLQTDNNLAMQESLNTRMGLRAPVMNALGQSAYEGMHFLASLFGSNLHLPEHWPSIAQRSLRYHSARGASYMGNHYKHAPIYLGRAAGHHFQVVTRL